MGSLFCCEGLAPDANAVQDMAGDGWRRTLHEPGPKRRCIVLILRDVPLILTVLSRDYGTPILTPN